jgi:MFS family permease
MDESQVPVTSSKPDRVPFYALLTANAISQIGNMMTGLAIPWLVLQTTNSPARTGFLAFISTMPTIILAFIGGGLADRFSAKRMSIISDVMSGLSVAAIPILLGLGWLTYPVILGLAFIGAVLDTPGGTARQSILPDIISRAQVKPERANAAFQAVFRFSIMVGPVIAGVLIASVGTTTVLWIDVATFVVSATLVALFVPQIKHNQPVTTKHDNYWQEMTAGLRFVRNDGPLLSMMAIFTLVDLLANSLLIVAVPVYAAKVFGTSVDYGGMLGAFGGGMFLGTVLYGSFGYRLPPHATMSIGLFLSSLPVYTLLLSRSLNAALVSFALMGFAMGPSATLAMTVFQQRTPPELRGRVFGARLALSMASVTFGTLVTGLLIERIGLMPTIAIIAVLYFLTCSASLILPGMRQIDIPQDVSGSTASNVEIDSAAA